MKLKIEFSEKTSPLFISNNDEYVKLAIKTSTQFVNDMIRHRGYATYESAMAAFGVMPNLRLLTCGWLQPDVFAVNAVRNDDGTYILEIDCREDIRNS